MHGPKTTQRTETGLVICIDDSLTFKRLHHLEQHAVESVWTELNLKRASPLLLGFVYRNPSERADWTDNFISMMETVCLESKEIILLGDFKTDLLQPYESWLQTLEIIVFINSFQHLQALPLLPKRLLTTFMFLTSLML